MHKVLILRELLKEFIRVQKLTYRTLNWTKPFLSSCNYSLHSTVFIVRVVFQPKYLKYLNVGISFPWQPMWLCFEFENMAERFPQWAWMLFTWILSQCRQHALKFWLHYLLFSRRKWRMSRWEWVVKTSQLHSWMKLAALRVISCICMHKLSNFDRKKSKHLNGFLCIHFGCVLLKTWWKGFLNERECHLLEFRPHFAGESQLVKTA